MPVVSLELGACVQSWSCVVFVGAGRRLGLLCASCIFVAVVAWLWYFVGPLLSFLDVWGRVTQWASCGIHGVDVVAKQTWIVIGRCVEVVGDVVGMVVVG